MFVTYETERVFNPFSTPENEEYLWSNASMSLQIPWFYISYTVRYDDGSSLKQTLLVSQPKNLKGIKDQQGVHIENIYLVSPDHFNNSEHWKMEAIKKILIGVETEASQPEYVYIMENGKKYFSSSDSNDDSELKHLKVFYEQ